MRKQKGQAAVEFALVVPLFFAMCFAMIYAGMMFMDYLQFNNAARAVARQISMTTDSEQREKIADDFTNHKLEYVKQLTKLYTPTFKVDKPIKNDVKIKIELTLNDENLPGVLSWLNFPPKNLKPIEIIMPLDKTTDTES